MLEGRVTLIAGAGGSGKTTLTEQIVRHVCCGHRLGRFELPEKDLIAWCLLLEDNEYIAQDRSLRVVPMGGLVEDRYTERWQTNVRYLMQRDFRIVDLRHALEEAREDGCLPDLIVIDHLRILIGTQPSGTSPNDWERRNLLTLIDLAEEFDLHIIALTHLNKEGKVSGTTELINCVDTAYVIEVNSDDRQYATLKCHKMRMSPETDYALSRKANGTWGFDDQRYVSENMAEGIAKDILKVLKRYGPKTFSELAMHPDVTGERRGIQQALTTTRRRGWITNSHGHWRIIPGQGDEMLRTPKLDDDDMTQAPSVTISRSEPDTSPSRHVEDRGEDDRPRGNWVLDKLKESVEKSRMHPVRVIRKEDRGEAPWTEVTSDAGCLPEWVAPSWTQVREKYTDADGKERRRRKLIAPSDIQAGHLVLLDRNGSYPSACSSVRLAPNILRHTGPLDAYDPDLAGLYRVKVPEWTEPNLPHPLGRAVGAARDGATWIPAAVVSLLCRLSEKDRISEPEIIDSWTGRANGSLFEHFYKESKKIREQGSEEEYKQYKAKMGPALQMLWSDVPSPFWRPDWRVSLVAEAAVRHWVRADQAVQAGATLVMLDNTDEAAFWTPDGSVPPPYKVGTGFGEVKIKSGGDQ